MKSLNLLTDDPAVVDGFLSANALLGVDVGFSETKATTGIAWCDDGGTGASRAGSSWASRRVKVPRDFTAALVAIDGPLLPIGSPTDTIRGCERVFQQGAFQRRCKPGMSHFGTGLALRRAAAETLGQFTALLEGSPPNFHGPFVADGTPVVEAFPNAFLGVMLPHEIHDALGRIRRGHRFDRLYDAARNTGVLTAAVSALSCPRAGIDDHIGGEQDHEKRAALICLMTAAFAEEGTAVTVGDPTGGWFWLPPWRLWAPWAREEVERSVQRLWEKGIPVELNRRTATP